ncbi:phosphatidylinositol 4,5-bisphosphate-binding protein [Neonectria magnoliae]|uniref:Phosphatidylinositol 4,5-bisphosphate-binding protein n=1 Tax=Neonectria magnoliae TaxID=2732573 RepID=A0ABR1I5S2_9HYPO
MDLPPSQSQSQSQSQAQAQAQSLPHQSLPLHHPSSAPQNSYYPNSYPAHTPSPASSSAIDYQRNTAATTAANTAANTNSNSRARYDDDTNIANSYRSSIAVPQPQYPEPVGRFTEEWGASQRGSSIVEGHHSSGASMQRSASVHSFSASDDQQLPARSNTLKKKNSLRRNGSLKRSNSRRSMRAGSVKSLALQSTSDPDEAHSAFHCPVPTSGNPTEVLTTRFQGWRKVLKDLIAYFREIQSHYEHRSKSLLKLANVSNNISAPPGFLTTAGIDDALQFLRTYNKNAILEANKAKEIEEDVILALTGLRSDLQQKIKEIKNLSGDFKNSVDKEMDNTRKSVRTLGDVLGRNELDESLTTGKQDPYLLRLAVDRQVERQIDEENYLHQAYLNLENSGRELESIVVGEIQKAYNAYAGILKREADNAYNVIGDLREGPISMPKDQEWIHFVTHDNQFVDPTIPLRSANQIHYPGQDHEASQEIRAGLLERKSKYLKSYTAGWYVLSATHLHEFKSADKVQAPVMSLYLPEQKLGSHSNEGGSSNKFILKGRQTGSMHRGHTWVFRAESHDTMMAWYEDIKALTEKTPEERNQFVRSHSRSLSRSSRRSVSSDGDGLLDDEDEEPFSAESQVNVNPGFRPQDTTPRRSSQAGGRFPSDIQVNAQRGLQASHSPSSVSSGFQDHRTDPVALAATGTLPMSPIGGNGQDQDNHLGYGSTERTPMDEVPSHAAIANQKAHYDGVNPYTSEPIQQMEPTQPREPVQPREQDPVQQYQNNQYFVPVVAPQERQEPHTDFTNPQGQQDLSYNMVQDTQTSHRYDDVIAAEQSNNRPYENHQANGDVGGKTVNVLAVDGEGFPNLGGPFQAPEAVSVSERDSLMGDTEEEDIRLVRPISQNARTESVQTISNLHVPGGYPKGTPI